MAIKEYVDVEFSEQGTLKEIFERVKSDNAELMRYAQELFQRPIWTLPEGCFYQPLEESYSAPLIEVGCECGASKALGSKVGGAGHSDWCPAK